MAKRIKRVFSSSNQVLHLWANQSQSDAKCSNVFFEGDTVYSYGYHYPLGKVFKYKGMTVAAINETGYSVTTRKHISQAKQAASHLIVVNTDSSFDVLKGLEKQRAAHLSAMEAHFRQRKFWSESSNLWEGEYSQRRYIENFNSIVKTLKHSKLTIKVTEEYIVRYNAHVNTRTKKQSELDRIAEAKREAQRVERAEKAKQYLADWKQGGAFNQLLHDIRPQRLRVKGDQVETTSGASVPLVEALTLLKRVVAKDAKTGDKVGGFTFGNYTDRNTVMIGCHEIAITEALNVLLQVKE